MRVLLTDRPYADWSIEESILNPIGAEIVTSASKAEADLVAAAEGVDAIGTCWAHVSRPVIENAGDLKIVSRFGIGLDNIDCEAAVERGAIVTNVPDYCIEEVADHALTMLLASARHLAWFHTQTKAGTWDLFAAPPIRRLSTQTIGVAGLGRIGQAIVHRALAFTPHVIGWNRSTKDLPIPQVSRDELFERSDFLVLAVPLTDETRHLINADSLSRMKPTATLINPSRGGLVDEAALHTAIESDRLAGAALDVTDPEPADLSDPLFRHERVIVTPHAAFVSEESLVELRTRAATQIRTALEGGTPENIVAAP